MSDTPDDNPADMNWLREAGESMGAFRSNLERAQLGMTAGVRAVLHDCATFLEHDGTLPRTYARFLAERFREIAKEETPFGKSAAIFAKKRGEKSRDDLDTRVVLFTAVCLEHNRTGCTIEEACKHVAKSRRKKSASAIKKLYDDIAADIRAGRETTETRLIGASVLSLAVLGQSN